MVVGVPVVAMTYTNGINESAWMSHTSVFECRLEHSVPYYGRAVFQTRAGETSRFFLNSKSSRFASGKAEVVAKSPAWFNSDKSQSLGLVPVKKGMRPMRLGTKNAEKYLSELNSGNELEFVRRAWYEKETHPSIRLALSTIGFRPEYRKYRSCLADLLPRNFDQLERTSLYFGISIPEVSDDLEPNIRRQLDNVLALVKHDDKIKKFYIDGHASAPGDRGDNLELSKRRAEIIADYLKRRGVPEDWIVVRWHGERYPVATNASYGGRSKNRRVTLRLERIEELDVLPLASK